MKGKEKNMIEIREIIHRFRMGQSKRSIHKELGVYRPIIRELHRLAIAQQWLDPISPMPSNEEIAKVWTKKTKKTPHQLDRNKEQIEQWHKEGLSSVVIYQLLKDKCSCDAQAVRRYRNKHFPKGSVRKTDRTNYGEVHSRCLPVCFWPGCVVSFQSGFFSKSWGAPGNLLSCPLRFLLSFS